MKRRIFPILLTIFFSNAALSAQEISFPYYKHSQAVEYSNYEKIEREMRRAAAGKKDRIVAVYRTKMSFSDFEGSRRVERTVTNVFVMLFAAEPFPILNRVDFITIGDKRFAAPQATIFPELYFTEQEFDKLQDGAEITGDYNKKFGKLDKKALSRFPVVEIGSKKNVPMRSN